MQRDSCDALLFIYYFEFYKATKCLKLKRRNQEMYLHNDLIKNYEIA